MSPRKIVHIVQIISHAVLLGVPLVGLVWLACDCDAINRQIRAIRRDLNGLEHDRMKREHRLEEEGERNENSI